jgi:hypothetical protein
MRSPSEITELFASLVTRGRSAGHFRLTEQSDIWDAVRAFFKSNAAAPATEGQP